MYQFIYDQSLSSQPITGRFFEFLRRLVLRFSDPIVHYTLNGTTIVLNMSHNTPFFRKVHPLYSANLERLATYIRTELGSLIMVDVGANIGDSYCLAGARDEDQYLLIEGERNYFNLLERNLERKKQSVTLVQEYLSERSLAEGASVVVQGGTSRVTPSGAATRIKYCTLDQIIQYHPSFQVSNLLKIDVDGYDCAVLRGATDFIASANPTIFFEYHPSLLAEVDRKGHEIFDTLSSLGYQNYIFYDNYGFLIGEINSNQTELIQDLTFYAMQKNGYYYDICCFHNVLASNKFRFLETEKAFYQKLTPVSNTIDLSKYESSN